MIPNNTKGKSNRTPHFPLHIASLRRALLLLCLMMAGASSLWAQTNVANCYVFNNGTYGYLYNNNGTLASNGTFHASSVWIASGTLGTTNRTLQSYTDRAQYMVGSTSNNSNVTIGGSSNVWQTRGGYLATYQATQLRTFYLSTTNGSTFTVSRNGYAENGRFVPTAITVTEYPAINITTDGLSSVGLSAANITYGGTAVAATLTSSALNKDQRVAYTDFLVSGRHYYWWNNADQTAAPTRNQGTVALTRYEWSLSGAGASYLSLANATTTGLTNTITYTTPNPNADAAATVTVKAVYADGTEISKTATITAKRYIADPTNISADNILLVVDGTQSVNPTLTCDISGYSNIYTSLSYASNNTAVASVNATTGVVTANAKGTATITITARLQGGGSITKDITVTVTERAAAPTITFNNATGELTMSSTTPGAEIHYTLTGSNPTSGSATYDPAHKPVLTQGATVKAITTADGYVASNVTTLIVEQVAMPTITVEGTTLKLACSTAGVTYYYTTDGSEPTLSSTSSTSTTFTTIPSGETIKVMAVKNGMVNSEVASKYVELSLGTPTITISDGKVTITSPDGATIHYTTDGSDPTASSPTYTAPLTATNGMTYKAIAIKAGFANSEVAEEKYMIASGVSGGTVTINDYEDHNWTYYQSSENLPAGYPAYLSSPDPRNVIITYRGGSVNNASAVAISGLTGEGQNEMIYYKTLEKTVLGMTGNYPYQVISNPFSKRPRTNGTTGTNGFWGFAGWKIISGGKYIAEHADNDVLGLDEIIHFTNLDENYTPNCKSGEVIFEATWTAATVKTGTTAQTFTGGTYETNFWVITGNTGNISLGAPCTMSARYPDGTSAGNNSIGTGGGTTITTTVDNVKIEFLNLNTTGAITADGRNFTMGRGITWSRTAGQITCGNRARAHTVKIQSGKYGSLYHFTAAVSGAATNQLVILGNDYDRAKKDNAKLEITGQMIDANANTVTGVASQCYVRSVVKSGSFMTGVSVGTGAYTASYYFGGYGSNNRHVGRRFMTIEGGEFTGSVCGGTDASSHGATARAFDLRVRGNAVINGAVYGGAENAQCYGVRTMIFTGGTVKGWVCAAANGTSNTNGDLTGTTYLYMGGNARVDSNGSHTVINRSVGGNVFAAGCGYQANNATSGLVRNGTNLVVADNTYIERGAYGGGSYGYSLNTQTTNIFITGGHVAGKNGGVNGTNWDASVPGGVYGGACQNAGGTINITMTGGLVEGGLYGGSNVTGTIAGKVTMQIDGGQVGTTTTAANVHGGGLGQPTRVNNDVEITLGKTGAARDANGVTVWGDVYGGSALGYTNGTTAADTYHTYVTMNAGYIHGSLYGGALGNAGTAANVYGPVQVKVYGGSVFNTDGTGANGSGAVYGANNINGAPQRSVTVDIYGTNSAPAEGEYALFSVYGGGNAADYSHTYAQNNDYPKVTVHNCDNSIEYVYGGGNAAAVAATDVTIYGGNKIGNVFGGGNGQVRAANVNGGTNVKIYGGTIGDVYGGSNTNGTIGGTISVNVNAQAEGGNAACPIDIDNVYGGGNKAASVAGNVTIGCAEHIGAVYGGANQANITGNINLNIVSGHIDNVFGGNNNSGNINGNITVTVNDNNSACGMLIGNVYGAGNQAAYSPTSTNYPVVNIQNGHLTGSVFGGGLGETAVVTANPQVTIGANTGTVHIDGNVFGGGDAANVVGKPVVLVQNCNTVIGTKDDEGNWKAVGGTVYGGGNAAHVAGVGNGTSVTINGGDINRVFGGGNGEVSPANVEGNAVTTIHAGNIHQAFAGSNMQGNISGSATITVDYSNDGCGELIDEVYGGGNQAAGNAGTVTINCGANIGDVYGGANAADINSAITLNITGGTINRVFGGNNTSGNISGAITVNVNKSNTCDLDLNYVYGAGNQAAYTPTDAYGAYPAVNILKGTVKQNVYGGGLGETAVVTSNPTVTVNGGTVSGNVFGGGSEANTVGTTYVTIQTGTVSKDVYGGGALADVQGNTTVAITGGTVTGNTYGGGLGQLKDEEHGKEAVAANVTGTTSVSVSGGTANNIFGCNNVNGAPATGATVIVTNGTVNNVYGGGNLAAASVAPAVNIQNGTVKQDVFGGGLGETAVITGNPVVTVTGGEVSGNVFGGGSEANTVGNTTVNVSGGVSKTAVYGGGALADIQGSTTVNLTGGKVHDAYGGGLGRQANGDNTAVEALVTGNTLVTLNGSAVTGSIFGANNINGTPQGHVKVHVLSTVPAGNGAAFYVPAVYGGGNLSAYQPSSSTDFAEVLIENCDNSIEYVYGGGNAAPVPATQVTIYGANAINHAFAGGNGAGAGNPGADVGYLGYFSKGSATPYGSGEAKIIVHGGTVNNVYGGSNTLGYIRTGTTVNVQDAEGACPLVVGNVFGGGNEAPIESPITLVLDCSEGGDILYGGANNADVGPITLNIVSGTFGKVFCGNNKGGAVKGKLTLNVDETGCWPVMIGELYGGGNMAAYSVYGYNDNGSCKSNGNRAYEDPEVNLISFTRIGKVFGGGYGETAVIFGNTHVNVEPINGIFADGTPSPLYVLNANDERTENTSNQTTLEAIGEERIGSIGSVYGGGNAGAVYGDTYVNIGLKTNNKHVTGNDQTSEKEVAVTITGNVFGGGNEAIVSGNTYVTIGD